ncbi:unnamed protein product [Mytilus coruscus]|uniref:DUF5641 domain-containing protein n=1 Tax=Mytilus coruscus TaxID=42192 RepID=A0A6J8C153_MYTCO|nr:unnamed protein product [Mytilus coruscus]
MKKILRENNISYKCCESAKHIFRDCKESVTCKDCGSNRHSTAMHIDKNDQTAREIESVSSHGGEGPLLQNVETMCTAIVGKDFLESDTFSQSNDTAFPLVNPDSDKELKTEILVIKSVLKCDTLGSQRFNRFSSWRKLVLTISRLQRLASSYSNNKLKDNLESNELDSYRKAENFIVKEVQKEYFGREIECLRSKRPLPNNSSVLSFRMLSDVRYKNLTHEVLTTFMAEVNAIINARPIVPVSTDSENPTILTPSLLLTQKISDQEDSFENITQTTCMYQSQWKYVQTLAEIFWKRWSREYLQTLQKRQKWRKLLSNLKEGDIILMREKDMVRTEWPIGTIIRTFSSENDNLIRKIEVRVIKQGKPVIYVPPITEIIKLLSE